MKLSILVTIQGEPHHVAAAADRVFNGIGNAMLLPASLKVTTADSDAPTPNVDHWARWHDQNATPALFENDSATQPTKDRNNTPDVATA